MPTLQDLTLGHSQRLSEVYRSRDVRLAEALSIRDEELRALSGTAKAFEKYEDELASAREKQLATDAKAGAARASALGEAVDRRSDRFEDAQAARRNADLEAIEAKRRREDAAQANYRDTVDGARRLPDSQRATALRDAERARRLELEQARRVHDEALIGSQQQYRATVDSAVTAERRQGRDGDRAYYDALRLGDAAMQAAILAAEQKLLAALTAIDGAMPILRAWRMRVAAISIDTAKAEQEEFSRFRRELQEIKV